LQEEGCNLTANSLHPGVIVTNIARYIATNSNNFTSSTRRFRRKNNCVHLIALLM
jgi:hypothetical protein